MPLCACRRSFSPCLAGIVEPPWLAWIAVFVGTFMIVLVPLSILTHRFAEIVKRSEIGAIDRALGFVFGIGRGLVIVGLGLYRVCVVRTAGKPVGDGHRRPALSAYSEFE